jgi:hypothetical protein
MRGLQAEFGWTRAEISIGLTIIVVGLAFALPFLGRISDRVRIGWVCVTGMAALAASLFF